MRTNEWSTPQDLFDTLNAEFNFSLDVCATEDNAKAQRFINPEMDGLSSDWHIPDLYHLSGNVWMNPPYDRSIGKWVEKAYNESKKNDVTVVCLLPVKTDTRWWHDFVMQSDEVRFIKGRLRFGNSKKDAPFPCCVVVFRGGYKVSPKFTSIDKKGNIIQ